MPPIPQRLRLCPRVSLLLSISIRVLDSRALSARREQRHHLGRRGRANLRLAHALRRCSCCYCCRRRWPRCYSCWSLLLLFMLRRPLWHDLESTQSRQKSRTNLTRRGITMSAASCAHRRVVEGTGIARDVRVGDCRCRVTRLVTSQCGCRRAATNRDAADQTSRQQAASEIAGPTATADGCRQRWRLRVG